MEHSVLGTRWVYDGLRDPQLAVMLAAVTMTGQGEALGLAVYEDRWYIAPSNVRIRGGWTQERVPVDGFALTSDDATTAVLRNDRFELTLTYFDGVRNASDAPARPPMIAPIVISAWWPCGQQSRT